MKFCVKLLCGVYISLLIIVCLANKEEHDLKDTGCSCVNDDCGCCAEFTVKDYDARLCANVSYLPKEIGLRVMVYYNDFYIINKTISATNPPAVCGFHSDQLKMKICLRFYNLNYTDCFSGCAEAEVEFFEIIPLKEIHLGCFGCRYVTYLRNELLKFKQNAKYPEILKI